MNSPSRRQAGIIWFALTALAVALVCALVAAAVWGLGLIVKRLSTVLMPIVLALILAYILDPVVEFFVRKKVPRLRAIILVFVLGLLLVVGVFASVIPGLVVETRELISDLPRYTQTVETRVRDFLEHSAIGRQLPNLWHQAFPTAAPSTNAPAATVTPPGETTEKPPETPPGEAVVPGLTQALVFGVKWVGTQLAKVTTWVEFLIGFVLVPVYLFYFLLEKEGITQRWTNYVPLRESKTKDEVVFILQSINDCLIVFIRGQVLVALCVGALLTIGYLLLGLNYAVLIGLVAAVLGIIPYVGAALSLAFALLVATVQFGDWLHPVLVLCIAAMVKLLEDFIISPKIIGDRAGLHPLAIILAVMTGAAVFGGILGAMIAIPLTIILRTLMFRYVWKSDPNKA